MSMRINYVSNVPLGVKGGTGYSQPNAQPRAVNQLEEVRTENNEIYVIEQGHPKTVYKKNPQTGDFNYVTQVYDGSWGKEMSNADLIRVLTTNVK